MTHEESVQRPFQRPGRRHVALSLSKERLDASLAYLATLGDQPAEKEAYNEAISTLGYAIVDQFNGDGWYLQYIEELEQLAMELHRLESGERSLPAIAEVNEQFARSQRSFFEARAAFRRQTYPTSRYDVLAAMGPVLFHAVARLALTHQVAPFLEVVVQSSAAAEVTPEQAFLWAALPHFRFALFKRMQDPTWALRDTQEAHRQVCQVIRYVMGGWLAGKRLDPGDFGSLGRAEPPADEEE